MSTSKKTTANRPYNFRDQSWCIDNGWQVYPVIDKDKKFRIAIRRNGIFSEGKDYHLTEDGVEYHTREQVGEMAFNTLKQLTEYLPEVYYQIRKKHE